MFNLKFLFVKSHNKVSKNYSYSNLHVPICLFLPNFTKLWWLCENIIVGLIFVGLVAIARTFRVISTVFTIRSSNVLDTILVVLSL